MRAWYEKKKESDPEWYERERERSRLYREKKALKEGKEKANEKD